MTTKSAGFVALALIVALAAGWVWGASGKAAVQHERVRVDGQLHFEKARAHVLDGRLRLVGNDYQGAGASFVAAVTELETLQRMLRELSQAELAGRIEIVLSHVKGARDAAASQNANAWGAADAALQALKGISLPE